MHFTLRDGKLLLIRKLCNMALIFEGVGENAVIFNASHNMILSMSEN